MQHDDACNHEWQQVVQREEAVERRIVDRKTTKQQFLYAGADKRNGREEPGDNGCTPEAHLAPWQNIAHEGCCHHQEEDDHTQNPQHFARLLVGAVIHAAENMDIDGNEEH